MDNGVNHILNVEGILKNFSIAKKITSAELRKIRKSVKQFSKSDGEYMELLKSEIIRYTDAYIKKNKIPGLIFEKKSKIKGIKGTKDGSIVINDPKYLAIYRIAQKIIRDLRNKSEYDKKNLVFLIMSLAALLGLTQTDFENFHSSIDNDEDDTKSWGKFGDFGGNSDDDGDDDDLESS